MSDQPPFFPPPAEGPPYAAPPGYGPPPYGSPPPPPYGYGAPPPGFAAWWGPPGRIRPTGKSILLFFVTFGIYGFVYNYSVHSEMKAHSGRGIGGGIALLLTFLAAVAMPFVTPAEVGNLYRMRGWPDRVNGWTGLWYAVPALAGNVVFFVLTLATASTVGYSVSSNYPYRTLSNTTGPAAAFFVILVVYVAVVIAGGVIWFVKTNNALNDYWLSVQR